MGVFHNTTADGPIMIPIVHVQLMHYVYSIIMLFFLFLGYNMLPRGFRKKFCAAYPRYYSRSSQYYKYKRRQQNDSHDVRTYWDNVHKQQQKQAQEIHPVSNIVTSVDPNMQSSNLMQQPSTVARSNNDIHRPTSLLYNSQQTSMSTLGTNGTTTEGRQVQQHPRTSESAVPDVVVSATMQELRDPGLRLIAHGAKTRARGIWVQLHPTVLLWHTETPKSVGREHRVPLADILYVDVGKQTDALRKMENSTLPENLCFSLLTKRGSLDLQAYSEAQRDAIVGCFSMVLDEIHTVDWRKIQRGPSSDYPSSVDAPTSVVVRDDLVTTADEYNF